VKRSCRTLLVSRRRFRDGSRGRSPDSRISLLANAFPAVCRPVASLLAFVPAYSGASVRDLHPLPKSIISRANIATSAENYHLLPPMSSLILPHQDQRIHGAVRETIVHGNATGVAGVTEPYLGGVVSSARGGPDLFVGAALTRTTAKTTAPLCGCERDVRPPRHASYHAPGQAADRVVLVATVPCP